MANPERAFSAHDGTRTAQVETLRLIVRAEMLMADLEDHLHDIEIFIEERREADGRQPPDPDGPEDAS